ncbi:MAG: iron-containing alcohol dehydrogenase [Microbacteriaceae bacterium]|nr:iron-containing alcohol dehydrogenase [Burkholderiaceae bacterium]
MKTGVFNYLELDRVHFGTPVADALHSEATQRGAQRIFVVTSRTLNRKTDAVSHALARIRPQVVGLFDECVEHTPRASVIALAQAVRAAQADLIVSIGGGTVIDTVKVALVALAEGLTTIEQLDDWHLRVAADGSRVTPQPRPPPCRQIAVPTTLSGAEFSDLGGSTDTRFGTKQGYTGAFIGAAAVILDPRITVHTPARLWLSTGVRAVDHAVEALCSINAQPLIDATSVRALALLSRSLTRYASDPADLDARLDGQLGAWLAATSIRRTEYGASHGLGHALGADAGVSHGITSCVLLPTVMRYNAEVCQRQMAEIAAALGDPQTPAADQVEAMITRLGLPTRLSQLGFGHERLAVIAQKGMANPWVHSNPRKIHDAAQLQALLEHAW